MDLETIIKEKKGTIVDVRTTSEFGGGHVVGSINIPLNELPDKMEEIKKLKTPLVLCCAAGGRSSVATQMLKQQGIECLNGGSWMDVNYYHSKN